MDKLKEGDVVEVIGRIYGHGFSIGDKVIIIQLPMGKSIFYECILGGEVWCLVSTEFKIVKEEEKEVKSILKKGDEVVILDGRKTDRYWVDSMTSNIGKTGIVTYAHKTGILVICVDNQINNTWYYQKGSYKPFSDLTIKGGLPIAGSTEFKGWHFKSSDPTPKKVKISSDIIMPDEW